MVDSTQSTGNQARLSFFSAEPHQSHLLLQVSNLFPRDEMEEILQELIPVMKKEFPRRLPTNEKLYDYFLSRTRVNLHVVLCFSPVSTPMGQDSIQDEVPCGRIPCRRVCSDLSWSDGNRVGEFKILHLTFLISSAAQGFKRFSKVDST